MFIHRAYVKKIRKLTIIWRYRLAQFLLGCEMEKEKMLNIVDLQLPLFKMLQQQMHRTHTLIKLLCTANNRIKELEHMLDHPEEYSH